MKSALAFVFAFIGFEAVLARPLPPLPTSAFADTEVTACHPLDQAMPSVCGLNLELAFWGTSSNNVEIVFGRDDDGDGVLSFRESDVRVGWVCGPASAPGAATRGRHLQLPGGGDSLLGFGMVCCLDLTPNDTNLVPRPSAIAAHTSLSDFGIIHVVLRFAGGTYRSGTDAANRRDPPRDRLFNAASTLHAVQSKYDQTFHLRTACKWRCAHLGAFPFMCPHKPLVGLRLCA